MSLEDCLGKRYLLVSSENFDEYLAFLGKNYMERKIARNMRQEECLSRNEDGTYSYTFKAPFISALWTFTLGEEFEETKPDGVKVTTVVYIEGNKMIHKQTEKNGRQSIHVKEFYEDKLTVTTRIQGLELTVTRRYKSIK